MKTCRTCSTDKPLEMYRRTLKECIDCERKASLEYYHDNKEVRAKYAKEYRQKKKDDIKEYMKLYRENNRTRILKRKKERYHENKAYCLEVSRKYKQTHRVRLNEYSRVRNKERRKTDPLYALSCKIRGNIRMSLKGKGYTKRSSTYKMLGTDFASFQTYLITTAIRNYGKYFPKRTYHLDHIIPCASAKTEDELIKLQHYTNFQLLYPKDNLVKGAKLPK